ncbi:MAG: conserved hypothetical secreted protein, partial [Solirubrobacterales bacterium]|nr:conserved hypothetical secreted protein [Solirubrobacterales bacterium]
MPAVRRSLILLLTAVAGVAVPPAAAQSPSAPTASTCGVLSPIAAPCTLIGKAADAAAAACRRAGVPDDRCTLPLSHEVTASARRAYLASPVHRNAVFQYALGDALPLGQASFLGTHNSFNSANASFTLSHSDSNQQLSLSQQLDVDIRALELDLHFLPRPAAPGGREVVVCHGQGPAQLDAGCTSEPEFSVVLPEIADWLNAPAHRDEVVLLYLEDELKNTAAYTSAVATLDRVLRRPDGSSLVFRPDPATRNAKGCSPLPLDVTRAQIRSSGARVILVGNCAGGWASDVFDWSGTHVESGDTSKYRGFPACDGSYDRATYAAKLVRYYEDSTLVATVVDP